MKFSEVIKALEENPSKKFESRREDGSIEFETWVSMNGYFKFSHVAPDGTPRPNTNNFSGNLNRLDKWKEVKQPVTWQEAVEAWANHKRVRCEIDGHVWTYDWNVADKSEMVSIEDGFGISPLEIKNGKWFIEEGNK